MNKTISINLGGSVFNIEEDAFNILKIYLENIRYNFAGDPAGTEIMADIEARIAEIFHEKNNERKNVVVRNDVEEMMDIMGKPEDYRMDDNEEPKRQQQTFGSLKNSRRRIYRDTDDSIVGGVCAGLSHYVGWDPIVVRLLVVFLCFISFGTGAFGYILFWALVPAATTTTEKLQMRGEPVNIENIGKFVNEETKAAADRINKFGRNAGQTIRNSSGDVVRGLGRALAIIFGLFTMLMGFSLLITLFSLLAISEFNVFGFDSNNWDTLNQLIFGDEATLWILVIGVIFAIGAPAIALIYTGIKLITRTPKRIRGLSLSLLSLFIIGIIMCTYGGIQTGKQFSRDAEVSNTTILSGVSNDTLYVAVMPDDIFIGRNHHHNEFHDLIKVGSDSVYYGEPIDLNFETSPNDQFKMVVERSSNGRNMEQAGTLARNISFEHHAQGDSLFLAPYFTTPRSDKYRGQSLKVTLYIPMNKYVRFGENTQLISWRTEGDVRKMTDDGLEELNHTDKNWERDADPEAPQRVKITDDSVIIKTGGVEIKTSRD